MDNFDASEIQDNGYMYTIVWNSLVVIRSHRFCSLSSKNVH